MKDNFKDEICKRKSKPMMQLVITIICYNLNMENGNNSFNDI